MRKATVSREEELRFGEICAGVCVGIPEHPFLSRDDQLVSGQSGRFHPPEGLLAHEQVEFVCGKGSLGRLFPAVAIGLGGIFLAAGLLNPTTNCYTKNGVLETPAQCASTNLLFAVLGGIMLMAGLVLALRGTKQRDTRYYVTTFRFVETKHGQMAREVPRDLFRGREFSQFLQIIPTLIINGTPFFTAKILDPQSGDEIMSLRNLTQESINSLQLVGQVMYCRYCGQRNDAKSMHCSQCGASL